MNAHIDVLKEISNIKSIIESCSEDVGVIENEIQDFFEHDDNNEGNEELIRACELNDDVKDSKSKELKNGK